MNEEIHHGHSEYKAWIKISGKVFSPFSISKYPHKFGDFSFWSVESIWQGTKVISINDPDKLSEKLHPYEIINNSGRTHSYIFPQVGNLKEYIEVDDIMRMLRQNSKYNGKRNKLLGLKNWERTNDHFNLETKQIISRDIALLEIHRFFFTAHLLQFPEELQRLRFLQNNHQALITDKMKAAHNHLLLIEEVLLNI